MTEHSSATLEKAHALVDATKIARSTLEAVKTVARQQFANNLPPHSDVIDQVLESHRADLEQVIAEVYAKHYSTQTMDAALAFFSSEAGREIDSKRVAIDVEVQERSRVIGREIMQDLLKKLSQ
ncbi:MAG: DUF2059 domain-containing protein [Hyphomicrobiaceae bacterium]|nr:DUF2059 domain-containing protein [Hyphomicrobiaceae bacterium]